MKVVLTGFHSQETCFSVSSVSFHHIHTEKHILPYLRCLGLQRITACFTVCCNSGTIDKHTHTHQFVSLSDSHGQGSSKLKRHSCKPEREEHTKTHSRKHSGVCVVLKECVVMVTIKLIQLHLLSVTGQLARTVGGKQSWGG